MFKIKSLKTKSILLPLALILTATLFTTAPMPQTAQAQDSDGGVVNQYDPKYRPSFVNKQAGNEDAMYDDSGIIPNDKYSTQFIRLPNAQEGKITLRITSPGSVSGCMDIVQPTAKTKAIGRTLKIEITDGRLNARKGKGAYSLHSCATQTNSSKVDITLDQKNLIEHRTNKIMISSRALGPFLNMKLDIDEEKAVFTRNIFDLARMGHAFKNDTNKTVYWFYPKNTVILFNSTLKITDETAQKLHIFAQSHGLSPITDFIPEFRTTKENRHKLYFVDTNGIYASQLQETTKSITIGKIALSETYHGAEGPYEKPLAKPVFIKRPNLYE